MRQIFSTVEGETRPSSNSFERSPACRSVRTTLYMCICHIPPVGSLRSTPFAKESEFGPETTRNRNDPAKSGCSGLGPL